MAGINKVILVGHLGRDPQITIFDNQVKKASFSVATTEVYKNREGQKVEQTEWHSIMAYRNLAEIAEKYLHKGTQVYLEGRLRTRTYDKDGQKHYITEVLCDTFTILSSRRDEEGDGASSANSESGNEINIANLETGAAQGDDLPF